MKSQLRDDIAMSLNQSISLIWENEAEGLIEFQSLGPNWAT